MDERMRKGKKSVGKTGSGPFGVSLNMVCLRRSRVWVLDFKRWLFINDNGVLTTKSNDIFLKPRFAM